jgi:hypothetical protein
MPNPPNAGHTSGAREMTIRFPARSGMPTPVITAAVPGIGRVKVPPAGTTRQTLRLPEGLAADEHT